MNVFFRRLKTLYHSFILKELDGKEWLERSVSSGNASEGQRKGLFLSGREFLFWGHCSIGIKPIKWYSASMIPVHGYSKAIRSQLTTIKDHGRIHRQSLGIGYKNSLYENTLRKLENV